MTLREGVKKAIDEILYFGIVKSGPVIIFCLCFIFGFILASLITCSNITPTFPQDYFSQIANACIVVLSVIIATIYAVIAIFVTQKDSTKTIKQKSKIGSCITLSFVPFLGIAFSFLSLILSAFSNDDAREFLGISVFITITSFGITYLVMAYLIMSNDKDLKSKAPQPGFGLNEH